jgi:ribosome-associated heat shock protein Hsp15
VRIDKWLWAVRAFKTRSDAAEACRNGRVTLNGTQVKPSREVKCGDVVSFRRMPVIYTYRIIQEVSSRQGAKNLDQYIENITPQEELDKLNAPNEMMFFVRDRGTGRPTKKDRCVIDSTIENFFFDADDDSDDLL